MIVAGLVKSISTSSLIGLPRAGSCPRVIMVDDSRSQSEQITRLPSRPDIILMSGVWTVSMSYPPQSQKSLSKQNAAQVYATYKLPLIYAGSKDAQDIIMEVCGEDMAIHIVDNLRPRHDIENLGPAREAITIYS